MNLLVEEGYLSEKLCGVNFSYILQDNSIFLSTEYKVLQSQVNNCFVKCMKMMYNNKIQLYYITNQYKPFLTMVSRLDADSFLNIVSNLLSDIIDVKHNGFLMCQNIDISFDHIYVDPTTYKVSLIYLPLNKRIYDDYLTFENELRINLVKLISEFSTLSSPKTMQFLADLSNGTLTLEDLYSRIRGVKGTTDMQETPSVSGENKSAENVRMIAMNAPERVEIEVTREEFVIGKNAAVVDGVISFNKMISRVHCKINKRDDQYFITDLQSANGTYVNRNRVQPNQPHPIKNGDVVRLADSDFQISIS